ncbi:MAG: valine--tRNA ligase [Parcubacteria group bacterium]|nr:valine--tRNA ligase [Parcubacteria group bacterium]
MIEKTYNPAKYEDEVYKRWERSGYFNPDKLPGDRKKSFSIIMPPPNVTGVLHVGHAVMLALEDLMVRYHRMSGYDTLWLPGTDHAAIATQTKVEKLLKERGKTRHSLGRENFLKEVRKYAERSKNTIHRQVRKMGSSCDWSREAYTLDEERSLAVSTVFKKMHDDGLIYRGDRVVNWCPRCSSTISDDEVEYKEEEAKLYTFKYDDDFPFEIATTRPETKLGDTAVAVHPDDERYKKYIGEEFVVDFVGKKLNLKIIGDKSVDKDFGTGALGVTPAHSMSDAQLAEKYKLKSIKVIGEDGKITAGVGKFFGLTPVEARERILKSLGKRGLLLKEEDVKHNLSVCYRCGESIEPLPSKQWFIDVNKKITIKGNKYFKNKSLKEVSIDVVKNGEIKIMPERFNKVYFHWMNNLRDWCISRQIWFGHQIPVWHKGDETYVGVNPPRGSEWEQDEDTLDTWFSSGLWTFSTLGWPENKKELKRFHPTSVLETGYDILFFWVARMILMTTYVLGEIPFENVYLHGLVRDEQGRKMSKSLGNVIDPLDVAEKYGTDAVRLSLIMGTSPGNDVKLSEEKIAGFRNFANKLWNIGRFISSQKSAGTGSRSTRTLSDKWILSRFNQIAVDVTEDLENRNFALAGEKLRDFTWGEFADWYLEISKLEEGKSKILNTILEKLLILWHPFVPYVTEVVWKEMLGKRNLIIAEWPEADEKLIDKKAEEDFIIIKEVVQKIRNLRSEYKIEPAKKLDVLLISKDEKLIESQEHIIKGLARVENFEIKASGEKPEGWAGSVVSGVGVYIDSSGGDSEKEEERLEKELEEKENYLEILDSKLLNKNFVAKAPKKLVAEEKKKKEKVEEEIENLKNQLENI